MNTIRRNGLTLSRYIGRPSQITRKRPSKRLRKRRARAPRRRVFPNPTKRISVYQTQIRTRDGWKTVAVYDSKRFSDPRGQAVNAARIYARIDRVKARVVRS